MKKHKLEKVFIATDADGEGSDSPEQIYILNSEVVFVPMTFVLPYFADSEGSSYFLQMLYFVLCD